MQAKDPPKSLNQKGKAQWSRSGAWLLEAKVSIELIVPQIPSVIPNNKIMTTKNIFHDINT
jgi:hypothetical protein